MRPGKGSDKEMLLTIDAGNTNVVFAVHNGEELTGQWRASTNALRTADEYMVWLTQLMKLDGISPGDISGAIIATVVPQTLFDLRSLCRRYFHCDPLVVGDANVNLGLEIGLERPGDVGADRLVNAVAAHASYEGSLVIIDFGTATTFDVVHADGTYTGGVIAPGINLSLEALHMAAAKLPHIAIARPAKVVGHDTVSAMQSGIYWGYIGLIEGLINRIAEEIGEITVVGTGGLAPMFKSGTKVIDHVDGDLTIRGLVQIYNRNRGSA